VIYLDSSVALAELLSERRHPAAEFWNKELVTSRLAVYEVGCALNRRGASAELRDAARELFEPILLLALTEETLAPALEPLPIPLRTLDALHVASMDFLRTQGHPIELATYDRRMAAAARALGFPVLTP
jgi:predicted nucleic acid-binding protein